MLCARARVGGLLFLIFYQKCNHLLPRRPVSVVSVRAARIRLKIERWQLVGGNKSWMGPLLMVCRRVQQSATFMLTSTRFFEFEDVHALLKLCCATILGTSALYTTVGWLCNTQNVHLVHRLHFPVWVTLCLTTLISLPSPQRPSCRWRG